MSIVVPLTVTLMAGVAQTVNRETPGNRLLGLPIRGRIVGITAGGMTDLAMDDAPAISPSPIFNFAVLNGYCPMDWPWDGGKPWTLVSNMGGAVTLFIRFEEAPE